VSLQPIRWLQDPLWQFKSKSDAEKMQSTLEGKIHSLKILPREQCSTVFTDVKRFEMDLAIIDVQTKGSINYYAPSIESRGQLIQTLIQRNISNLGKITYTTYGQSKKQTFVPLCLIGGHVDPAQGLSLGRARYKYFVDGKCQNARFKGQTFEECKSYNLMNPDNMPVVEFNTANEARNFYNYITSTFMQFFVKNTSLDVHVQINFLPFLKSYKKPITQQLIQSQFDITKDEYDTITQSKELS
jgi:hypothetical protein